MNNTGIRSLARKLEGMGRDGDTILAHIMPHEAEMLKRMGGRGSVNPRTGLLEFSGAEEGGGSETSSNYGGSDTSSGMDTSSGSGFDSSNWGGGGGGMLTESNPSMSSSGGGDWAPTGNGGGGGGSTPPITGFYGFGATPPGVPGGGFSTATPFPGADFNEYVYTAPTNNFGVPTIVENAWNSLTDWLGNAPANMAKNIEESKITELPGAIFDTLSAWGAPSTATPTPTTTSSSAPSEEMTTTPKYSPLGNYEFDPAFAGANIPTVTVAEALARQGSTGLRSEAASGGSYEPTAPQTMTGLRSEAASDGSYEPTAPQTMTGLRSEAASGGSYEPTTAMPTEDILDLTGLPKAKQAVFDMTKAIEQFRQQLNNMTYTKSILGYPKEFNAGQYANDPANIDPKDPLNDNYYSDEEIAASISKNLPLTGLKIGEGGIIVQEDGSLPTDEQMAKVMDYASKAYTVPKSAMDPAVGGTMTLQPSQFIKTEPMPMPPENPFTATAPTQFAATEDPFAAYNLQDTSYLYNAPTAPALNPSVPMVNIAKSAGDPPIMVPADQIPGMPPAPNYVPATTPPQITASVPTPSVPRPPESIPPEVAALPVPEQVAYVLEDEFERIVSGSGPNESSYSSRRDNEHKTAVDVLAEENAPPPPPRPTTGMDLTRRVYIPVAPSTNTNSPAYS